MKISYTISIILSLILFIIMWTIAGWQTADWDWVNYERDFHNTTSISLKENLDISYLYITKFIRELGFSFYDYRKIIYFAYLSTIAILIFKFSSKPLLLTTIYFTLLFFRDTILIRNTLALGILSVGIFYLLRKNIKHNKSIYMIFWLISCTFHLSFLEYGIFLLCDKKINLIKFAICCLILSFFAHTLLSSIIGTSIFSDISALQTKADRYMSNGSYISLAVSSFHISMNYLIAKILSKKANSSIIDNERFIRFNGLFFVMLIFSSINMEFMRLYKNMLLINSIIFINFYLSNKNNSATKLIFILFWIIWNFLWTIPMSGVGPQIELILSSNTFWK